VGTKILESSFRDPSGFLFYQNSQLFRQINNSYKENYNHLIQSGLYKSLVDSKLLIPHTETKLKATLPEKAFKVIKPEPIPFISYPYEWCFSQLKDAGLLTLRIQKRAMDYQMSLIDCTAYNIQFKEGKPVFIDTLSFEKYREGEPWVAYRQFCQHFFGPLALMAYKDIRLSQLFRIYIDGLPLDLSSSLLPFYTRFIPSLYLHIHLHAKSQERFANKTIKKSDYKMSRFSFLGLIDGLETAVKKLTWAPKKSVWGNYYEGTNYTTDAHAHKTTLVAEFLDKTKPKSVWDIGANVGMFSRISSNKGINTISFDMDSVCVEKNYLESVEKKEKNILPLIVDLTNPSPNLGWENKERMSLLERAPTDLVMALALIHHLAISNNLSQNKIASFFSKICKWLIIEFVPKQDSQVQKLLSTREDIFTDYTQKEFEKEFKFFFIILNSVKIKQTERTLYLLERI